MRIDRENRCPERWRSEWDLARGFVQLEQWPYFVQHEPDLRVDAHYHRTTEELQVLKGAMTFFPVGSAPAEGIALQAGEKRKSRRGRSIESPLDQTASHM